MHRALSLALLVPVAARGCAIGRAPDVIAARVGGEAVMLEELDVYIMDDLFQRETHHHNPSRTHELRAKALARLVRTRALEGEAKRRGLDVDALVEAEEAKQAVSDESVAEVYERNRAKLRGATLEQTSAHIRDLLVREQAVKSIMAAVGVETLLEPPRVGVGSDGPSRGPVDAAVTIVEFSDFQCPFCQRALPVLESVAARYPDDVRIVYRHLPLDSIHPQARAGAEASACAAEGGRFWEYHDLLFANPRAMSSPDLHRYAEQVGLEPDAFDACLSSRKHAKTIEADVLEANALGISGTPAFVVNGILLFGLQSEEALEAVVREELARRGS